MKPFIKIKKLGYQPKTGIYAWANGINVPGSAAFIPANKLGIVTVRENHQTNAYLLPIDESKKFANHEILNSFKYSQIEPVCDAPKSLTQYANVFKDVFKDKGAIGLAFMFASIHRNYILKEDGIFPHLFFYGPAGSGKTFMAKIISGVSGVPLRPINCITSSTLAFHHNISKIRNGIVYYDEYSKSIKQERTDYLINMAEGKGRLLALNNKPVTPIPILSACIISGQKLPTDQDLLNKCICVEFDKFIHTNSLGDMLMTWTDQGKFSFVTSEIFSHRKFITENYDWQTKIWMDIFKKTNGFSYRQQLIYSQLMAIYAIVEQLVELPYCKQTLYHFIVANHERMLQNISGTDVNQ